MKYPTLLSEMPPRESLLCPNSPVCPVRTINAYPAMTWCYVQQDGTVGTAPGVVLAGNAIMVCAAGVWVESRRDSPIP